LQKNDQDTRRYPGDITWVRALGFFMCKERPHKLYKIKYATKLIKWFLNGRLDSMMFFFLIYIEKEQIRGAKNDQDPRKFPGHVTWVRAFGLFMCKEEPLKLYKIDLAFELVKCLLNGRLVKLMFFSKFIYRKSKSLESDLAMRKSPGHVPWVRALGLFMCK
jgi:hypothetical protein